MLYNTLYALYIIYGRKTRPVRKSMSAVMSTRASLASPKVSLIFYAKVSQKILHKKLNFDAENDGNF